MSVPGAATFIALTRAIYPAITETVASDALLEVWLPEAVGACDAAQWGSDYTQGVALYLAHLVQSEGRTGRTGSGRVQSVTTGGLSMTWASTHPGYLSPDDAELGTTPGGRRFLALRNRLAGAVVARIAGMT